MGKYDLGAILNVGEDIDNINGKTYKIRQLTIKERVVLDKVLQTASKKFIKNIKPNIFQRIFGKPIDVFKEGKDSNDFFFIKTCLDFCNPEQPFTFDDFETLTTNQTIALQKIISDQNYFFDIENLLKEVKEKLQTK